MNRRRCAWVPLDNSLYVQYHDGEWGIPVHDDRRLFEKLVLEGFQSGLSWLTILRKRDGFRRAFHGFDAKRIVRYDEKDVARLMADEGIVRYGQIGSATFRCARARPMVDRWIEIAEADPEEWLPEDYLKLLEELS